MPEQLRRKQHLVSKGYQRNFADGEVVSVLDAHTGRVVWARRSIQTNWRAENFLSVVGPEGQVDDSLEREFGQSEGVFLKIVREIRLNKPLTPAQKSALDALAATHALRSRAFALAHHDVVASTVAQLTPDLIEDQLAIGLLAQELGRPPYPGELEDRVAAQADHFAARPDLFASGLRRSLTDLKKFFAKTTVQLVGSTEDLPGFILPDHPVVHGKRDEGRFGFHNGGAIGDADTIVLPISRRLVAFYSSKHSWDVQIRTKRGVRWVNALLLLGAQSEVACHPADVQETNRLIRDRNLYPPEKFDTIFIH